MSINDYIAGLESVINSSTIVSSYNLNIDRKTFPHHKHLKNGTIVESQQVKLSDIISEIEGLYIADEDKMKTLVQETFENEFNEAHFKEFVKNLFNHFDFSKEHTLKHQFNDAERQALNDFTYFGTYEDAEKKSLDVLTVELKSSSKVERARSLQRNLIGKYLKTNLKDSALVAFYSKDNPDWRLSFVKMDYRLDERGVKVEIGTPPKRYSFLVGKTEPSHTAQKQLLPLLDERKAPTLDEIEKSFSIEKVTKEFYTEIAKKFTELVGGERKIGSKKIVEAGQLKYPKPSDTLRKEFTVRLIGRLMFCWFLKKKKSEGGVPLIPNVLLSSDAISQYPDYYHSLLEPLFFQVLNTPIEKRNKSVRHSFWNNVPFLNGGLFEPHLYDYYEIYYESGLSKYINTLKVPDSWFLDLFKIFEIYNFTIDESTSIDIDISVDPEMLGRIFENLLAEINPQTGETARKSTGSYYTPRPIVEYMVDESLKQYLLTQISINKNVIAKSETPHLSLRGSQSEPKQSQDRFGAGSTISRDEIATPLARNDNNEVQLDETKLSRLLSYGDWEIELTETEKDSIIDALDRAKIIDPACGSGAFPMGILHKMLLILQKIDPESKQWLSKKLARIDNDILRKELEKKLKTENWDYVHKLGIIQNSIYGVDIQPIAVEISKLRFFLSLIVDEKIDDDKPNRGVVPLPNLEFKFVAANSLIGLPKAEGGLAESHKDIEKLKKLRDAYFTSYGNEKREIENEFKETQEKMFQHALNWQATGSQTYKLSEWNPFADEASSWFDPEWMFGVKDGFDIVIANPPYIKEYTHRNAFDGLRESPYYQGKMDIWYLFACKYLDSLKNKAGVLTFIATNNWVTNSGASKFRNKIAKDAQILKLIDFGDYKIFETAGIQTMVMMFQRDKETDNYNFDYRRINGEKIVFEDILDLLNCRVNPANEYLTPKINRNKLINQTLTFSSSEIDAVFKKMLSKSGFNLNETEVANGIHHHHDSVNKERQKILGDRFEVGDGIFVLSDKEKKNIPFLKNELELLKPSYTTKELHKWHGNSKNKEWVIYTDSSFKAPKNIKPFPNIKAHLDKFKKVITSDNKPYGLHRARDEYFFKGEKIIAVRKCIEPTFTYTDFDCYVSATFYVIKSERIDLKFLTAILNSKLIAFWLKHKGKMQGNNYQIDKEPLLAIPIYNPSSKDQQPFITLVDRILAITKDEDYLQNPDKHLQVKALEQEIDQLVYNLYGLHDKEIGIITAKK